jgi:hypothetical protein
MKKKIKAKKKPKRPTSTYWKHLLGKPRRKAKPKPKARRRVKPMAKKKTAKDEQPDLELAEQEPLPPPDPPKVKSEPTEPPAPDAVLEQESVGADPEDSGATFELDIIPEATRGEGPKPEAPEEAPEAPEEEDKKKEENPEAKAKQLKADEAAEQEFLTKQAK